MTGQRICSCQFCDRDDLTPQGIKSHQTHCDENPNPGIPYEQQVEMGLLDDGAEPSEPSPNPDQRADDGSAGLPDVQTLSPAKSKPEPVTDGGEPAECPLCGHDDVMAAAEAKTAYIEAVGSDSVNPKAVLGYELADHACQNPKCGGLWGEEYHEPLPMDAVVSA